MSGDVEFLLELLGIVAIGFLCVAFTIICFHLIFERETEAEKAARIEREKPAKPTHWHDRVFCDDPIHKAKVIAQIEQRQRERYGK